MPLKRLWIDSTNPSPKRQHLVSGFETLSLCDNWRAPKREEPVGLEPEGDAVSTGSPYLNPLSLATVKKTELLFIHKHCLKHLQAWTPIKYYNSWKVLYDSYTRWCLRRLTQKSTLPWLKPNRSPTKPGGCDYRDNQPWCAVNAGFAMEAMDVDCGSETALLYEAIPLETSTPPPNNPPGPMYSSYGSYYAEHGPVDSLRDETVTSDMEVGLDPSDLEAGEQTIFDDYSSDMDLD